MSSNEANAANYVLEHPLLKVPYEGLSQAFKTSSKLLERDTAFVTRSVNDLVSRSQAGKLTTEQGAAELESLVKRLKGLKRKLDTSRAAEEGSVHKLKARLTFLDKIYDENDAEVQYRWRQTRLDRLLVDFLLREGHYDTAVALADSQGINDYVDVDVFLHCRKVVEGLQNRDCSEALAWCQTNRSRLRRLKSTFEFRLRLQEFLELARESKLKDAIAYARKHLAPVAQASPECLPDVQAAMGALAFLKDTTCEKYRKLFDENRWTELIEDFKRENYALYSMTSRSLLDIAMQAGLSALKTESCHSDSDNNRNCPVCLPELKQLAERLPLSRHIHSSLVCRITGKVMNEDNPPMVLPNGYVYSKGAIDDMARNGKFECPRSREVFEVSLLRKAFIS